VVGREGPFKNQPKERGGGKNFNRSWRSGTLKKWVVLLKENEQTPNGGKEDDSEK